MANNNNNHNNNNHGGGGGNNGGGNGGGNNNNNNHPANNGGGNGNNGGGGNNNNNHPANNGGGNGNGNNNGNNGGGLGNNHPAGGGGGVGNNHPAGGGGVGNNHPAGGGGVGNNNPAGGGGNVGNNHPAGGGGGNSNGNGGTTAPIPTSAWTDNYQQWLSEHPNPGHSPGTPDNATYAAWLQQHPNPGQTGGSGGTAAPSNADGGTYAPANNVPSQNPTASVQPVPQTPSNQPGAVTYPSGTDPSGLGVNNQTASAIAAKDAYAVRSGDTLSGIAAKHGLSLSQIEALNPQIKNAGLILPGQAVNINGATAVASPAPGQTPVTTASAIETKAQHGFRSSAGGFPTTSTYPPAEAKTQGITASARIKSGWAAAGANDAQDPAQRAVIASADSKDTNPLHIKDNKS